MSTEEKNSSRKVSRPRETLAKKEKTKDKPSRAEAKSYRIRDWASI